MGDEKREIGGDKISEVSGKDGDVKELGKMGTGGQPATNPRTPSNYWTEAAGGVTCAVT